MYRPWTKTPLPPTVRRIDDGTPAPAAKRLCVFASFDSDSRLHQVTVEYLRALRDAGAATVFVTTSASLAEADLLRLRELCVCVVQRDNLGYDFFSWKAGLLVANEVLDSRLPILLTNDSILGPLRPLDAVFDKLEATPNAVWGLTDSTELGVWHLQSYFLHVPTAQADAGWFREFWRGVDIKADKDEIIRSYELGFTQAALRGGASCLAVFPSERTVEAARRQGFAFQYRKELDSDSLNTTLFMWDILVRDLEYPFIKAELIRQDRFSSLAVTRWLEVLPDVTPSSMRAALVAFEEQTFWRAADRTKKRLAHKASPLRDYLDERPHLRDRIHQIRSGVKRGRRVLTRLAHGQWRIVYAKLRVFLHKRRIERLTQEGAAPVALRQRSRDEYFAESKRQLATFLFSGGTLDLTPTAAPRVTIVLILYNKAELTYRCLRSLAALRVEIPFQVLIIDNRSTDDSETLASRVRGARYIRNAENLGFLLACNQARDLVDSELTLFLNNDTEVHPGSLAAAVATLDRDPRVGAVGARVILPGGLLQEAGNILWNDGTCVGYARDKAALAPEAMFEREVDYCSGAFLMTRTELFRRLGGFDLSYAPAYYEETDFCVRLWKAGYSVVYQPRAAITHVEFGSAEISGQAIALMTKNRATLCHRHADFLGKKLPPGSNQLAARSATRRSGRRLLILDDRVPHAKWGAGYPRASQILRGLLDFGFEVTIGCTEFFDDRWHTVYSDVPPHVEVVPLIERDAATRFLRERLAHYDWVWCSRPSNLAVLRKALAQTEQQRRFFLIYDAEAFFADRAINEARVFGVDSKHAEKQLATEIANAAYADLIVAVSESDRERWAKATGRPVIVIGHEAHPTPTPRPFAERADILCLGSLHGLDSPNGDALSWFMREAMPHLRARFGGDVTVHVAGYVDSRVRHLLSRTSLRNFKLVGPYDDPAALLDRYRVVVIPTRYAAGIPQKAFDAAIHGVPTVCSPLIASQLSWRDGRECLIGSLDDPRQFADACARLLSDESLWRSIRDGAMAHLRTYDDQYSVKAGLRELLARAKISNDTAGSQMQVLAVETGG
jgi:GT2 family glycosyltransferase/glycosyltransferase involved in cell wall biosynthesis